MSGLIKVNSESSSVRYIDLGGVRLTSYDAQGVCKVAFSFTSSSYAFHFTQESFFHSSAIFDQSLIDSSAAGVLVVLSPVGSSIDFTVGSLELYKAVCELFSLPVLDDVIQAFESEV